MTDELGNLVHQAGRRTTPPDLVRAQVYAATRDAWRRQVRRRMQRRQLAVAASVLGFAIAGGLLWLQRGATAAPLEVASVESVSGEVRLRSDSGAGDAQGLQPARTLRAGDEIETTPGSRMTLRRPGGIRIHIGGGSQLAWQTNDALRVTHGLVYVDTDAGRAVPDPLEIVTHTGRIRHVGTRFSVQVDALDVHVMVRDGAVAIGDGRTEQRIESGHGATMTTDGQLLATALSPGEGPWQWLGSDTPRFSIEGRHLDAVLQDLAQASGLALTWSSPQVEASAHELVLHGPALELDPQVAIDTVLLTTQLTRRAPLEIVTRP